MKLVKISGYCILTVILLFMTGCEDDPVVPDALNVLSITATGTDLMTGTSTDKDLNAATAASDVPLDAVIKVSFNKAVDASTVNTSSISLSSSAGAVSISVSAAGSDINISHTESFERGIEYTLVLASTLKGDDGGAFSEISRSFKSAGRAASDPPNSSAQTAYFPLNGNANAAVGSNNGTESGVTYTSDRFGNQESAALFDGDVSLIEVPNGDQLLTPSFTLSYWMYIDSSGHKNFAGTGNAGHFAMGIGDVYGFFIEVQGSLGGMKMTGRYSKSDGTTTVNDFFFNGDGKDANNGGWVGVEFEKDISSTGGLGAIIDQSWTHVIWTYDASTNKRSLYLNGELMETDNFGNTTGLADVTGHTYDDSDAGSDVIGKSLAFGFNHDQQTTHWSDTNWGDYRKPGANHLKGALDDIRFFSASFSESDALELYNAEKN